MCSRWGFVGQDSTAGAIRLGRKDHLAKFPAGYNPTRELHGMSTLEILGEFDDLSDVFRAELTMISSHRFVQTPDQTFGKRSHGCRGQACGRRTSNSRAASPRGVLR